MKHQAKSGGRSALFLSFALLLFAGCSDDANQRATQLLSEASQTIQQSKQADKNYGEAWDSYQKAKSQLDRILSEYSSSDVAIGLSSGNALTSGLTLDQFRGLEAPMKELAEAEQSHLSWALLLAKTLNTPGPRADALCEIAIAHAKIGKSELALQLLSQSLENAKTWDNPSGQSDTLIRIAGVYAGIGHTEKASQILSDAFDAAQMIEDDRTRPMTLGALANRFAEAGAFDQALKVLEIIQLGETIKYADNITSVMKNLAIKATKAGENKVAADLFSQLLEFANENKNEWVKSMELTEIAELYAEAGLADQASQILTQAFEATMNSDQQSSISESLCKIAGIHAKIGNKEKAFELLCHSLSLVMETKSPYENDRLAKAGLCTEMAKVCMEIGRKEEALELQMLARDLAKTVEHPSSSSYALCEIAGGYAKIGEHEKVNQLLQQALVSAKSIETPLGESDRDMALAEIGRLYAQIGEFKPAIQVIMMMEDAMLMSLELGDLASTCATSVELDQLLAAAKTMEDEESKAWVLADIAAGYTRLGAIGRALKTIESSANEDQIWASSRIVEELIKLSKVNRTALVEATQTLRPLSQFWESAVQPTRSGSQELGTKN